MLTTRKLAICNCAKKSRKSRTMWQKALLKECTIMSKDTAQNAKSTSQKQQTKEEKTAQKHTIERLKKITQKANE